MVILDSYNPTVYGVGYLGDGKYLATYKRKKTLSYSRWNNILHRCYSKSYQEKQPTYRGVSISVEWRCFQNFAEWFKDNYIEGFELDKDILIKGNKIYSPETCCFVPQEINSLFKNNRIISNLPIGVSYDSTSGRYKSVISRDGKLVTLGRFNTPEEASIVYIREKEKLIVRAALKYKDILSFKVYEKLINYKVY